MNFATNDRFFLNLLIYHSLISKMRLTMVISEIFVNVCCIGATKFPSLQPGGSQKHISLITNSF